MRLYTACVIG